MATFQVATPEKFDFRKPETWQKWIKRFERFRTASELSEKSEEAQVNTLLYSMGPESDEVLSSLKLSADDLKKYDTVKGKFNDYVVVRRNVIIERAKFNQRMQNEGESVDNFITSLYTLAEHCGYNDLHDEMIRDRIVVGLRDRKLSEKLQMDEKLTLDKAVKLVRQSAAVKEQQVVVRQESNQASGIALDAVRAPRRCQKFQRGNRYGHFKPQQTQQVKPKSNNDICERCGNSPHSRNRCPAADAQCMKCGRTGHFAKMCRNKAIRELESSPYPEDAFLGAIDTDTENGWMVDLSINGVSVRFKIDTGADVTVIPEEISRKVKGSEHKPDRILYGPANKNLIVTKMIKVAVQYNDKTSDQEIYVVKNLKTALLGRPAIEALNLLMRVENVNTGTEVKKKHPKLFDGLGKTNWEYKISLKDNAKPYALSSPRRVPLPLMNQVKEELERMQSLGVITKVDQPTDWCAGMVVAQKPNGKVRICVDLTKLNESVRRENYPIPSIDQELASLSGASVFTKLDANSGFWQIPLAKESSILTSFITPYGRFRFNRLPFGIASAPEFFQKRMSEEVAGLPGVLCHMDDILISGKNQEEHDNNLERVLQKIEAAGLTLNDKCVFSAESIKYLGHIIDRNGIRADPDKVRAINDMRAPTNVSELCRFLGMVNQLSKLMPNLAETTKPLRDLLRRENQWYWDETQQSSFENIKRELCSTPILAHYDPSRQTIISSDSSSYGLGAVLIQKQEDESYRPIAFASRSLTNTEQRYAQIEKEALASTWACEKFSDFIVSLSVKIETDHKPLLALLGSKRMDELPARIQRFRMRLMRFDYSMTYVPGKHMYTADTLSRSPVGEITELDKLSEKETEALVDMIVGSIEASDKRLEEIRQNLPKDKVCSTLLHYVKEGWPDKFKLPEEIKPYWTHRGELNEQRGLLMKGNRLVIPKSMQKEILSRIHTGHLGITKCQQRAKETVFWIGLSKQVEDLVKNCDKCQMNANDRPEPLMTTNLPSRPWEKLGTDMFEYKGSQYLLVIDYYSRYVEVAKLTSTSSETIVNHLKSIFSRHGIPEVLRSDNGPQYASKYFADFASQYGFSLVTSSPRYPQSNGEAERAVQTVKNVIKKSDDPYLALMAYRATPIQNGFSPSELLMGKIIKADKYPSEQSKRKRSKAKGETKEEL
ncbi:hypothetical protein FSP39_024697 [Pinctada imbricata]|uniref:Endonuclease n=2 Tax=Pinctada imbricata TaxID=66713 RepID=A0AA88YGN9_PINIB|nr:hypothetical protein FSP39_024697 [Pinctada imbricata]